MVLDGKGDSNFTSTFRYVDLCFFFYFENTIMGHCRVTVALISKLTETCTINRHVGVFVMIDEIENTPRRFFEVSFYINIYKLLISIKSCGNLWNKIKLI